jgi:hypothetical protein
VGVRVGLDGWVVGYGEFVFVETEGMGGERRYVFIHIIHSPALPKESKIHFKSPKAK